MFQHVRLGRVDANGFFGDFVFSEKSLEEEKVVKIMWFDKLSASVSFP